MNEPPFIPEDPAQRFIELSAAVLAGRRWYQSQTIMRSSCMGLLLCPGEPQELARALHHTSSELQRGAGWFGALKSEVRYAVAANLVRRGQSAGSFAVELDRVRAMFREQRLPRGGFREVLAILILSRRGHGLQTPTEAVERMAELYRAMRREHSILTGTDDYPTCAMLCGLEASVPAIISRNEKLYVALHKAGFWRGNPLQGASHILGLDGQGCEPLVARFGRLYQGFRGRGLNMTSRDYANVAILSHLEHPADVVVAQVLADREGLRRMPHRPSRQQGFNLACGTAFLSLATAECPRGQILDAGRMVMVVNMLQAQEAACMAAVASGAAASAS